MQPDYWLERWKEGRIGFHQPEGNARLAEHHPRVLGETIRVLVPLCGKSADLEWLAVQGHEVVGIELSELAARAFFSERNIEPERSEQAPFVAYRHGAVTILVGDFFAATPEHTGYCDGAYDRAALIALPAELRARYAQHLPTLLAPKARLLLVTLDYDAEGGPPFRVSPAEVTERYAALANITPLGSVDAFADTPGPVQRGASFVNENSYLIAFR
ncbi:MAG TPA: thiopurine S-methyltransferase [Polyangiaceae bacterium]|nr:thiopurine S-methyltransferase [Polyangiaceae bacterium]